MLRRFLRLLLVPLMLANQGLCLAHVHRGSDHAKPEDHTSRPHFHVAIHHHQTHDHQQLGHSHDGKPADFGEHSDPLPSAMSPVAEHDSDAVYCSEASIAIRETNSAGVASAKWATLLAFDRLSEHSDWLTRSGSVRVPPASIFDEACPIYLRTLVLRI